MLKKAIKIINGKVLVQEMKSAQIKDILEVWCEKNNCELFVLNDLVLENDKMGICWQRYYLFDILDANEIEYDQICLTDADSIYKFDNHDLFLPLKVL